MHRGSVCLILGILFLSGRLAAQQDSVHRAGMQEFELHPDCQMELAAAEPLVVDPITVRFDGRGRMWVVEMRDYPTLESPRPTSRIKILEDRDRDGFFETAKVFADQLLFPTGIQIWKNGVIVTLEGRIVYLADDDGDCVCDHEEVWFTGFARKNTQLRANHPTLGPDGKIYVANGLRNGDVRSNGSQKSLSISGKDFRFDPLTLQAEAITGYGQYGLTFDDAGNRFTCTNRNPLRRIVVEAEYLRAIRGVSVSQTVVDVAAAGPDSHLYPISQAWTTSNLHANQFTAACGVHVYTASVLGDGFYGNAFTCDPTASCVHREIISYQEAPVMGRSKPARQGIEFLASRDASFRPVDLTTGPDGALYVVDMRRTVIEHPQFMPPELKRRPDLRQGQTLGRVYRVFKKGNKLTRSVNAFIPEVDIYSPNPWRRATAHRMLVQNPDSADLDRIRNGLGQPQSHFNGVIRALTFLQSRNGLQKIDQEFAVNHYSAAVRAWGVRVCENNRHDLISPAVLDENATVRFQALLSCSRAGIELPLGTLQTVALSGADSPALRTALVIAAAKQGDRLLERLVTHLIDKPTRGTRTSSVLDIAEQLVPLALAGNPQKSRQILEACLQGVGEQKTGLDRIALRFLIHPGAAAIRRELISAKSQLMEQVRSKLRKNLETNRNLENSFLLLSLVSSSEPVISRAALDDSDPQRQLMAVRALHQMPDDAVWLQLVSRFRSLPFELREQILQACLGRPSVARGLLDQVAKKEISPVELGNTWRNRLMSQSAASLRQRAQELLRIPVPADREVAFKKYQAALALDADPVRGKPVFEKTCATCHQLGKLGHRVGPDISDTRTKSKSQLLLDIIRPNAAIDNNYVEFIVDTVDGQTFKGILVENNATGVVIKQPDREPQTIARSDIERIRSTGKSLMPVGLEQDLSLQQMADLISFVQNWRYLEQKIPYSEKDNAR